LLGDIFFDNHLPIRTPTTLELIKAKELPRKTIIGFPDSAESINVAIWVLSPSSAINIVVKVVINIEKKLFSYYSSGLYIPEYLVNYFNFSKNRSIDVKYVSLESNYKKKEEFNETDIKNYIETNKDNLKIIENKLINKIERILK